MSHHQYHTCIEACVQCAQECDHCADACLQEADVTALAECIGLDRDCAQFCWTAAAFMSRQVWGVISDRIGGLYTMLIGSALQACQGLPRTEPLRHRPREHTTFD